PAELLVIGDDLLGRGTGVPGLSRTATVDGALVALGLVTDSDAEGDENEPAPAHRSPARRLVIVSGIGESDIERLRQSVDQRPDRGVTVVIVGTGNAQTAATVEIDAAGFVVSVEPEAWVD